MVPFTLPSGKPKPPPLRKRNRVAEPVTIAELEIKSIFWTSGYFN